MALQFSTTNRVGQSRGIKCLVYGPPGSGKTTLLGTAPNALIVDAEAGLLPLRNMNIPVVTIKSNAEMTDLFNWLAKSNDRHAASIETVCMDSISEMAEIILADQAKKISDGRQLYGKVAEVTIAMLKAFRDIPNKNVVLVGKEKVEKNELTGITMRVPGAPGQQIGPALPYLVDEVFHTEIQETGPGQRQFYLRTWSDPMIYAKDRSGRLSQFEAPNLADIFAKINS